MLSPRSVVAALAAFFFASHSAFALDWEIERNFRYFLYPSDVAVQRVARDIYVAQHNAAPTPEQSELQVNGAGFWTTKLADAGDLSKRWPIDWPRDGTIYDLVKRLRQDEGRPLTVGPQQLGRLGWAVLLAEGRDAARPVGFTATCWNPGPRMHTNCARWGDYVRPPGWIVRVFDPDAPAGQICQWAIGGAVVVDASTATAFAAQTQRAGGAGATTVSGDCREIRIVIPSDPADPKAVAGHATVSRTSPDGSQASLAVTPRDRLVIGFGDSFTSGEGNPERVAVFNGHTWTADRFGSADMPARDPDPTSLAGSDSRAQWTDRWCHRSVYSWQIRTGLTAALGDLHQSLTILPYGCSGATIMAGLLYEYNGVEWSRASDRGVVGSRAEIGLAYQEMCQPSAFKPYCSGAQPWCGPTRAPSDAVEAQAGFYDRALAALRRGIVRCGAQNVFKRSADALLIDIGVNDVGFARWAAGVILQDGFLRWAGQAFTPCFDPTAACTETRSLFDRLNRRYGLLRNVLDNYLLPEFGIDPSHVIVAIYPPALENEEGVFCPQSNTGLTVATFSLPPLPFSWMDEAKCEGSAAFGVARGVLASYPADPETERQVEQARVKLNESLAAFALRPHADFNVLNAYAADFERRGVCATTDPESYPPAGQACFTMQDIVTLPCAPGNPPSDPESTHAARATLGADNCGVNNPAFFHPFPPSRFEPYRHRTRLFRTMNDVFVGINQRPDGRIDASAFGTLDLTGRTTGGAFHPTAEGHALIANEASDALCQAIGCSP